MKRLICLTLAILLLFCSCQSEQDAYAMLSEFVAAYGAEGVIYSPSLAEGKPGYLTQELVERIFLFTDGIGDNYAILLNSHVTSVSECGIFVCDDDEERRRCEEVCLERVRILNSDNGFVKSKGRAVYYSTLSDSEKAERIFKEIIN